MPYRVPEQPAEPKAIVPHRHSDLMWLKRMWQRFTCWRARPFVRPRCWACGETFAPERRYMRNSFAQCTDSVACKHSRQQKKKKLDA